jgi:predicted  nucleic acid-binding Zn-ribbon protein
MTQARALLRLQNLDLELDTRRSRAREITAVLDQDEELRQAQTQVAELDKALRPQETYVTNLNLEIQTVGEQTAQLTDRLYGGAGGSPKELEDLQHKIAERKRRRAHLEDELLETMIRVEELQAALVEAQTFLKTVEAARGQAHQALLGELQRIKRELKVLKDERQTAAENVAADHLELYENLRARKKGQAVAVLNGDSCSVCRVEQTANVVQQVRQGPPQLVMCTSCGRILVAI